MSAIGFGAKLVTVISPRLQFASEFEFPAKFSFEDALRMLRGCYADLKDGGTSLSICPQLMSHDK